MAVLGPEAVHDLTVLHRVGLSRYSTTVVRRILTLLNRTEQSLVERLARTDNESLSGQRLEALIEDLRQIQAAGWRIIKARMEGYVAELAPVEADFAAKLVALPTDIQSPFSPLPSEQQIVAAVNSRPFQGRILRSWLQDVEEKTAARVRDTIRQGFIEGRPTADIVRALRGTRAAQYQDGILQVSRRSVEGVVRTALTHTSNTAMQTSFEAMGVKEVIWTSTLDARTSAVCQGRSEQVFPIDKGPRPPAHWNCRSVIRPKVDDIPGVKPFAPKNYQQWLKGQPAEVQDDILGPSRGALFRRGGLQLDRFVDRAGKTLTLDQLRRRDAGAFEKAGI